MRGTNGTRAHPEIAGVASLIAVVTGGVLPGITGAPVAIPAAAAVSRLPGEVTFRRLDNS